MPRNIKYTPGHFPYHSMLPLKEQIRQEHLWDLFDRAFKPFPSKYYREPTTRQQLAKIVNSRSYQKLDLAIREREACKSSVQNYFYNRAALTMGTIAVCFGVIDMVIYFAVVLRTI
jgi:hypothetical protein